MHTTPKKDNDQENPEWIQELNNSVNRLSPKALLVSSIASFIAIAALLVFLLIKSSKTDKRLLPQSIRVPTYIMDSTGPSMADVRRKLVLRHLTLVIHQLDSLQASPFGRPVYDSLLRVHPHLRDSLVHAQHLFLQPLTVTP